MSIDFLGETVNSRWLEKKERKKNQEDLRTWRCISTIRRVRNLLQLSPEWNHHGGSILVTGSKAIPTLNATQQDDPSEQTDVTIHPSLLSTTIRLDGYPTIQSINDVVKEEQLSRRAADGCQRLSYCGRVRGGSVRHRLRRIRPKARKRRSRRKEMVVAPLRKERRRKCPLRPLSSFEVHERLSRTKRRRSGYSLPFLLSRGVLPFPLEARTGEPLHGPFTITIIASTMASQRGNDWTRWYEGEEDWKLTNRSENQRF